MEGDVTVRVSHSTLNYKDGLAITGKGPGGTALPDDCRRSILPAWSRLRTTPISRLATPSSAMAGGWARRIWAAMRKKRASKGDWLVRLPEGMTPAQAMAIGTAGYTAMLCVMGTGNPMASPPDAGPALVTGRRRWCRLRRHRPLFCAGGMGSDRLDRTHQRGRIT